MVARQAVGSSAWPSFSSAGIHIFLLFPSERPHGPYNINPPAWRIAIQFAENRRESMYIFSERAVEAVLAHSARFTKNSNRRPVFRTHAEVKYLRTIAADYLALVKKTRFRHFRARKRLYSIDQRIEWRKPFNKDICHVWFTSRAKVVNQRQWNRHENSVQRGGEGGGINKGNNKIDKERIPRVTFAELEDDSSNDQLPSFRFPREAILNKVGDITRRGALSRGTNFVACYQSRRDCMADGGNAISRWTVRKSRKGNVAFRIKSMLGGLNRPLPLLPPRSTFSLCRKIHRRKTYVARTPIRGRRLHEHEWSESEDGTGSITSGSGLSGAAGSCRSFHAGISAAPGRGWAYHLDSSADVSTARRW